MSTGPEIREAMSFPKKRSIGWGVAGIVLLSVEDGFVLAQSGFDGTLVIGAKSTKNGMAGSDLALKTC
jgi:hypothetical protein